MEDFSFQPTVAAYDDESNDDIDFLEPEDDPEDFYWLSQEQMFEMNDHNRDSEYPTASDWKEDAAGADLINIDVTIDKARQSLWKQGKTEMGIMRKVWNKDHPSFEELAAIIFGPRSKLFHLMEEELDIEYKDYCRFLATFFTAAMVSVPAPMLFDTDLFNTTGLVVGKREFLQIYRKIDSIGAGKDDTFWMAMEDCFNNLMKKMFLSERGEENLSVALDDDKHHFNYSKNADTYGLARCRHIKDNRFGHVCHTAGLSATGLPLCASFQREQESSSEKYEKMMKGMFGSRTGEAAPNLQGITLFSDRGYWTPDLVFNRLLRWGADLVGTVARTHWYPFTFSKGKARPGAEAADPHGRIIVPMKGHKDAFYRTLNWNNNVRIRATAYKSGTGTAVSLAMSTVNHYPVFDLNTAFPKDCKHYFDPTQSQASRNTRAFPVVAGSTSYIDSIHNLPIHPLTTVQGDTSWFIMRKFSLTSSTVDKLVTARAMEVMPNMAARAAYETVLEVVGRLDLLPDESLEEEENAPGGNDRDGDSDSDNDDDGEQLDAASFWIKRVNEDDTGIATFCGLLNTLDDTLLRAIVAKHTNSKPDSAISTIRKQLDKWANCESKAHRKYHWYNKQQLIDCLKAKDPRVKASVSQKGKPFILSKLIEAEARQQRRASLARGEADPDTVMDEMDSVLLCGFMAWYMKKLSDEAKKYCRAGHDMEKPFLEEFHKHSVLGLTCGYKSIAIHETPLVSSNEIKGALDSSDAELVYKMNGDDTTIHTMPIELKARLSHSTFYDERNRLESNLGFAAWENGHPVYVELDAESEEFHRWIPKNKESFQLLHHVAIRNLRKGLIVIGNGKKIMFGVFVKYSDETIIAYRNMLADLFDRVLKPFYDDELDLPEHKIEKIVGSSEMESIGLSVHSFQTSYFIWKRLRIDRCLPLPLPPCNRILPYNHSHWNNQKGASDTATKLFWNCRVMTASWGRSQTVVVSKYIQLFSVALHRMHQVATAKTDLTFYASIHHYRNTRNRHEPYHKTLERLRKYLIQQADDIASTVPRSADTLLTNEVENILQPRTPARIVRSNPRAPFQEHRNYATYTGGTPGKGRAYDPQSKCLLWEDDQQRLKSCKGILYKTTTRKKCCICGSDTNFACIGCKRWYCMCSRDKKLTDLIAKDSHKVSFLNGERPPSKLVINFVKDSAQTSLCIAENSCYHIVHRKQISQTVAEMLSKSSLSLSSSDSSLSS